MAKLAPLGRMFFAIGIVAFGILHLWHGAFVTRVAPPLPAWIPQSSVWAYVVGVGLVVAGLAIVAGFRLRAVAIVLGVLVLVSALLFHLPLAVATPINGGLWTNFGKALALSGGAFIAAATVQAAYRSESPVVSSSEILLPAGRFFFAAFLILCGVQHFIYFEFVQTLVPGWIPGHGFWTYLSGAALIAGGVGIALPLTGRVASVLTGSMIFLWVILLHLPRALSDLHNANETTAVFEALAMSGIAFMLTLPRAARPQVLAA
jgi:uncharacterized membrane protein YphA (DoxX/SURF4 family)